MTRRQEATSLQCRDDLPGASGSDPLFESFVPLSSCPRLSLECCLIMHEEERYPLPLSSGLDNSPFSIPFASGECEVAHARKQVTSISPSVLAPEK